jgi:flagellar motor switch protein FliM
MLKLQPLAGVALLDIPPRVGLCLVDRELGGPGRAADETAQIGKIEAGLLNRIADLIIQEWCNVWSDHLEIHATVSGTESNSRFLSTSTPDTNMLVVGVEFRLGDIVEPMQFAFPHPMLEPLTAKLGAGTNSADAPGLPLKTAPAKWNSFLDELPLELQAEIPEIELPASQVAELKPGDVLTLPSDLMSQIKLRIANHPGFVGSLGEASQHRAIRIEKAVGV